MSGIDRQPSSQRSGGCIAVAWNLLGRFATGVGGGKGLGVQLHPVCANGAGSGHLAGLGVHEQAHAGTGGMGLCNQGGQAVGILRKPPAVVAGELAFGVGHKRDLLGPHRLDKTHEVVKRVAFDVELAPRPLGQQRGQVGHVVRTDVALVRPGVHGKACGTHLQTQGTRTREAGNAQMARVAHGGHLIEVDRQRATLTRCRHNRLGSLG